jgi:hypothetical protein
MDTGVVVMSKKLNVKVSGIGSGRSGKKATPSKVTKKKLSKKKK